MSFLKNFFGGSQAPLTQARSILDLVTNTATLASDASQIDPFLDNVRAISSRLAPGENPSAEDEAALLGVYLKLEDYLTTKEPIRAFTKEELRSRLSPELRDRLAQYENKRG